MITNSTMQVSYSWQEFGDIVTELSEKIYGLNKRVDGLTCHDKRAFILAYSLCEKLNMTLFVESQPGTLDISLDNLIGKPDVVITFFSHEDEQFNLYHTPQLYHDTSTIDVEGRQQKIIFPWH